MTRLQRRVHFIDLVAQNHQKTGFFQHVPHGSTTFRMPRSQDQQTLLALFEDFTEDLGNTLIYIQYFE
jgi:hypothetical protein